MILNLTCFTLIYLIYYYLSFLNDNSESGLTWTTGLPQQQIIGNLHLYTDPSSTTPNTNTHHLPPTAPFRHRLASHPASPNAAFRLSIPACQPEVVKKTPSPLNFFKRRSMPNTAILEESSPVSGSRGISSSFAGSRFVCEDSVDVIGGRSGGSRSVSGSGGCHKGGVIPCMLSSKSPNCLTPYLASSQPMLAIPTSSMHYPTHLSAATFYANGSSLSFTPSGHKLTDRYVFEIITNSFYIIRF